MLSGMLDAVQGCLKEEMRMSIISNNLANVNVMGFKKDVISFQDLLKAAEGGTDNDTKSIDQALVQIKTDISQGDIRFTGNTLDFAIYGEGFFKVDTPDGMLYSRKGNFTLDNVGFLTTQEGYKVMGEGGPIGIFGNQIHVNDKGVITADGAEVGRIDMVTFENASALVKDGMSCYRNVSGEPETPVDSDTKIQQGYVELSNVNVAEEMVNMIHCSRAFEGYQKAIQVLDGVNNKAINEVSRLR